MLEYAISRVQETIFELDMAPIKYWLLRMVVNLIDDIRTIERNANALLNAYMDISLAENTGKN